MITRCLCLALVIVAWAAPLAVKAADTLPPEDRAELQTLSKSFFADLNAGNQTNYPKYLDDITLAKYAEAYRRFLSLSAALMSAEQFAQMFTFTPDFKTVIEEQDPVKFFASVKMGPAMLAMAKSANQVTQVVGIAGDKEKAYIVLLGKMDGEYGMSEPHYSVWPAVRTAKGWRLDGTTTLLRSIKAQLAKFTDIAAPRK